MSSSVSLDHPLVSDILTSLRDKNTEKEAFRSLCERISTILAVEAARSLPTKPVEVQTPMESSLGQLVDVPVVVVPILRAGLGMLGAFLDVMPGASVGFVGVERVGESARPEEYYCKTPDMDGAKVFVVDPMLATGGSALDALRVLRANGATDIILVTIISAPEGIQAIQEEFPEVELITGAIDRGLDDRKYIRPGLGDFGDRLFGTTG